MHEFIRASESDLFAADVFRFRSSDPLLAAARAEEGAETADFRAAAEAPSYLSGGEAASSFNIALELLGAWSDDLRTGVTAAADFLSDLVTGDLPEMVRGGETIDDLRIEMSLEAVDGRSGIVGYAGPTVIRPSSLLPFEGVMTFDSADAGWLHSAGMWEGLVLHEMMHVLGFGTLWEKLGLLEWYGDDLRFTGEAATAAYFKDYPEIAAADTGAALGVPVETDGGAGTAEMHWDEETFGSEFMTGEVDGRMTVSKMSVAALADMGYETVLSPAPDEELLFGTLQCFSWSDAPFA